MFPPPYIRSVPNPASTELFKTYASNAPNGTWPENTRTHQGLYCMTAAGDYLSGGRGRQSNANARKLLNDGWRSWTKSHKNESGARPVPSDRIPVYGGNPLEEVGLKLRVSYRDLPRGEVKRPGDAKFPNPYNLGWFDLTPAEAMSLVPSSESKTEISTDLFRKLATKKLKDSVRGQMNSWKDADFKNGTLWVEKIRESAGTLTLRLTGSAELRQGERSFAPTLFGSATFDQEKRRFTDFKLLAVGQRTGKGNANGRETDLGPAPMAVCFEGYIVP